MPAPTCIVSRTGLRRGYGLLHSIVSHANYGVLLTRGTFSTFTYCPLVKECLYKAATDKLCRTELNGARVNNRARVFSPTCHSYSFSRVISLTSRVIFGSVTRFGGCTTHTGKHSINLHMGPRISARSRTVCSPYSPKDELNIATSGLERTVSNNLSVNVLSNLRFRALYRRGSSTLRVALSILRRGFYSLLRRMG